MQYSKIQESSTTVTSTSSTTSLVTAVAVIDQQVYRRKMATYKGLRKISLDLLELLAMNGNAYIRVLVYIIKNVNSKNRLINSKTKKRVNRKNISDAIGITPSAVSTAITSLIADQVIKKDKYLIVMNPYKYVPYNTSDNKLYILQQWWDSDFTYDIEAELLEAEEELQQIIADNTPNTPRSRSV